MPSTAVVKKVEQPCPLCGIGSSMAMGRGPDFEFATSVDEWTFKRCAPCDVVYLDPRPELSELSKIYPYDYYAYTFQEHEASLVLRVKSWLNRIRARRYLQLVHGLSGLILDIGCGDGHLLGLIEQEGVPATRLIGLDFNERAAQAVRARGYRTFERPIEELEEAPGSYALIIMNQVIEHLVDPRAVIRRCAEWLEPGGCLILETPNTDSLDFRLFSKRYWGGYHIPRHWVLFNPDSLGRLAQECGLEVAQVASLPSPFAWVWSFHHWLSEHGAPRWVVDRFHWQNSALLGVFTAWDLIRMPVARTSNMRVVARKPAATDMRA